MFGRNKRPGPTPEAVPQPPQQYRHQKHHGEWSFLMKDGRRISVTALWETCAAVGGHGDWYEISSYTIVNGMQRDAWIIRQSDDSSLFVSKSEIVTLACTIEHDESVINDVLTPRVPATVTIA